MCKAAWSSPQVILLCGALSACASGGAARKAPTDEPAQEAQGQALDQDRVDEILRLCNRKAGTAVPTCWNDEFQRTKKKFEAQVTLMIVVSASGEAEDVRVVAQSGASKELQDCLVSEARSWPYPAGKVSAPVNCGFFLKSSM